MDFHITKKKNKNKPSNIIPYSINYLFKKLKKNVNKEEIKKPKIIHSNETIIELLSKEKELRTLTEIKIISKYLAEKFEYFKKINESGEKNKLEKIVSVLNLEKFEPNQYIIKYGQEGDKFYIVLKGKIKITKPIYIEKCITLKEFLDIMYEIKHYENDYLKYDRINEKNLHLNLNIDRLLSMDLLKDTIEKKYNFIIEEEEDLGIFYEGFPFGEIALIKRYKRNANIKALNQTYCITLTKHDYHRVMIEIEQKRLERTVSLFQKTYPLFQFWTINDLIKLFNCLSTVNLNKGDYLYKQNENSDYIYLVKNGVFEIYSMVSLKWAKNFFYYINSSKNNLINILNEKERKLKDNELIQLYDKLIKNKEISPCNYDPSINQKIISNYESSNSSLIDNKKEEEKLMNKYKLFKVFLRTIDTKEIIGIEDSLELKKRFYFVKCISPQGELHKIYLFDFFKMLNLIDKINRKLLNDLISEKKRVFFRQIVLNSKNNGKRLDTKIDYQFNMFLMDQDLEIKRIVKNVTGNDYQNIEDVPKEYENEVLEQVSNSLSDNYLLSENNKNNKSNIKLKSKLNFSLNNYIKFHKDSDRDNVYSPMKNKKIYRRNFISPRNYVPNTKNMFTNYYEQCKNLSKKIPYKLKVSQKTISPKNENKTIYYTYSNKSSKNMKQKNTLSIELSPKFEKEKIKNEINKFEMKSPSNKNFSKLIKNINNRVFTPKLKSLSYREKLFPTNFQSHKSIKKRNLIINQTSSNDSYDENILYNSTTRYANFKSIINGKKIFLKKNFTHVLEEEKKKDKDKPKYPINLSNK
jgi:CRP-like cAMP-binding protein